MAAEQEYCPFDNVPNLLSIVCTILASLTGWELTVGKQYGENEWVYVLRAPDGSGEILRKVDASPCSF